VIPVPPGVRVLIATRPVDFRKGADSLAALAKETLGQDPFAVPCWCSAAVAPTGSSFWYGMAAGWC
jgi:IS66 Orf2 like protein